MSLKENYRYDHSRSPAQCFFPFTIFTGLVQVLPFVRKCGSQQKIHPAFSIAGLLLTLMLVGSCQWLNGCSAITTVSAIADNPTNSPAGSPSGTVVPISVSVEHPAANSLQINWNAAGNTTGYSVVIDDTETQRQPILKQSVSATALTLDTLQTGLAPGVTYYITVNPGNGKATFRLASAPWPELELSYGYAQNAWTNSGRLSMSAYSGVCWETATGSWTLDNSWPDATTLVAQDAYNLEYTSMAGVNMAAVQHDLRLLDELASFYLVYENRFTTLGAMRAMTQFDTSLLAKSDLDSTETLIWVDAEANVTYVRECDLCNSQFYYSVSRLLRIITTLQPDERTPAMLAFVNWYGPVLGHDHLLRLLERNNGALLKAVQTQPGALSDTELWLTAEAAELLGANANEPELLTLTGDEREELRTAIRTITSELERQYRTYYAGTQNIQRQVVGSVSYFNGAARFDISDYAYSGYIGERFPAPADAAPLPAASWDISHFHRVPILLRALYDNRKATGVSFASAQEIGLVVNQFLYRNFQGNFGQPLFNNYFDGSNGWYRVGYHGPNFGYPPAQYCDNFQTVAGSVEPCLTTGVVHGWGLISFVNPDLEELQYSLATLALSEDPSVQAFRQRYYYCAGQQYEVADTSGDAQYPLLLFFVMAGNAQHLQ
jgi:hypothetical protein